MNVTLLQHSHSVSVAVNNHRSLGKANLHFSNTYLPGLVCVVCGGTVEVLSEEVPAIVVDGLMSALLVRRSTW